MKEETKFRKKVVEFLKTLKNVASFPIQQLSFIGDPDFLLCINGRFIGLELKSTGGSIRPLQAFKGESIVKAGGLYLVAYPQNWTNIKEQLSSLDREKSHGS